MRSLLVSTLVLGLLAACQPSSPAAIPEARTTGKPAAPPAPTAATAAHPAPAAPAAAAAEGDAGAPSDKPQPAPAAAAAGPPPPLPKGTTVLHVGDSMADALGKALRMKLGALGIKNILEAKEATYIPQWAGHTMKLSALLYSHDPDLVIVTLGGNEVGMPDPTVRAKGVRRIVEMIGHRPCLWIAAPLWPGAPHTGVLEVIRANCAPCIYVDTNVLLPDLERTGDKIHPTIPERHRWARFMIRWMQHNRDPNGEKPWTFKQDRSAPPPEPATSAPPP